MAERIANLFNGGFEDDGDLINSYFDQSSTTGEDKKDEETMMMTKDSIEIHSVSRPRC